MARGHYAPSARRLRPTMGASGRPSELLSWEDTGKSARSADVILEEAL